MAPTVLVRRCACLVAALVALMAPSPAWATLAFADPNDEALQSAYDACEFKFYAASLGGLVAQLKSSSHKFTIDRTNSTPNKSVASPLSFYDSWNGSGTGATILWNPTDTSPFPDGVLADGCATLYHELYHAGEVDQGQFYEIKGYGPGAACVGHDASGKLYIGISIAEVNATRVENEYRISQHLDPRLKYGNAPLPPLDVMCNPPPLYTPPPIPNGRPGYSRGDPHLATFDGTPYDFQAAGEFVLARASAGDLEVQVRQAPVSPDARTFTLTTALATNVAGDRVGVYARAAGLDVHVAGMSVDLSSGPVTLSHGGVVSILDDGSADVRWPDGSELVARPLLSWGFTLTMSLAPARQGSMEGLLGNFDGDPENDLVGASGVPLAQPPAFADLYPSFADHWRIDASVSLFDYGPGESTETFTDRMFPDGPDGYPVGALAAAEAICRDAGVYDPVSLSTCIADVALTGQTVFATDAALVQSLTGATLTVSKPGATATLVFAGTAGETIFVDVPSCTVTPTDCANLALRGPDQTGLASTCIVGGEGYIGRTVLPATGLYSLVLSAAGSDTGSARLWVITEVDQEGDIDIDGAGATATIAQPGEVARFTFTGTANQTVFVDVPSSTLPDGCDALKLIAPDGTALGTGCILGGTGSIPATVLPATGAYTLLVAPAGAATGQATLRLHT